jgi:hypothetical protein
MTVTYQKPEAKVSPQVRVQPTGVRSVGQARPLSHEAGHVFMAYVDAKLGRRFSHGENLLPLGSEYGHPLLPDWFDEAVATLSEFPALQQSRRTHMQQNLEKRIPFSELFVMRHPWGGVENEIKKRLREEAQTTGKRTPGVVKMTGVEAAEALERVIVFYSECLTLAQFLVEREGPEFIGRMVAGMMNGKSMDEILRQAKSAPASPSELEKAWLEWIKEQSFPLNPKHKP